MDKKEKLFNFRLTDEIREKLRQLADQEQRNQSDYLRWLINREYKAVSPHLPDNGKPQGEES